MFFKSLNLGMFDVERSLCGWNPTLKHMIIGYDLDGKPYV